MNEETRQQLEELADTAPDDTAAILREALTQIPVAGAKPRRERINWWAWRGLAWDCGFVAGLCLLCVAFGLVYFPLGLGSLGGSLIGLAILGERKWGS